ncbi:MAG: hypothetical protein IPI30_18715 [Saprospiraceae bacterium]|nr:hypothetical protein [Candidatus Vicinibacter affinis]
MSAPEENHKVYSFGVQLDWVNEYFISGTLQIRWPGQKGIQFSPLNFNRRNGDEISLGDILIKMNSLKTSCMVFLKKLKINIWK